MSLRVLLRDQPQRSIAIVADSHALVFRHNPSQPNQGLLSKTTVPRCMVEFATLSTVDLIDYRSIRSSSVYGTLGLININKDVFLSVITAASPVATLRPGENVQRIVAVEFYCLNKSDFDGEIQEDITHYDRRHEPVVETSDIPYELNQGDDPLVHPCLPLSKVLGSGTFYYSVNFDLTNRLQNRSSKESAFEAHSLDESFLWNSYMIDPLIQFRSRLASFDMELLDASHILTSAIRGYVHTIVVPASSSPLTALDTNLPSNLTLISRLSCRRAGTRFNARGIDDDGNVANFVETETIYWFPSGLCFSYAQIRGSVPVFWEQAAGLLPHQQKIQITRSPEATQPAFDKHFEELELNYDAVHVLNLLSESKIQEVELTERYDYHIRMSPMNHNRSREETSDHCLLKGSQFDFHAETKGPGGYEAASMVRHLIQSYAEAFAYYLSDNVDDIEPGTKARIKRPVVVLQQEGVFRTNCLDCLDRTNLIQTIISQMALESFLRDRSEHALSDFWMRHSTLWADNGDALSKIYAGTGALKSSFTRHGKMSFAGAFADARKSATRLYINNFVDKGRQNIVDTLLGRLVNQAPVQLYDPINDYVMAELKRRSQEYTSTDIISIWVGTFNLNGKGKGTREDLSAWLCPKIHQSQRSADVVAVGFQEMVELNAQQIMSTDPARRQEWELAVARTLNEDARKRKSEEYVLLRSGQLVGAALLIFVKSNVLKSIKNVEGSVKKTGLSGIAGNKGAVAIRMDFANTRICFVTAHLAAGFANYDERNRDYQTISHGLRFQRNRAIEDHDTILWLGDFNYRIGLTDDKVRKLINVGDLGTLYQNDQLHVQMVAGNSFPFYSEAKITFLPTYKYDNGTDEYDTSEKARIPAWCDRILRKGDNLRQIHYNTAPLRFSDHRPVFATFECTISVIDEGLEEALSHEIYNKRRLDIGNTTANGRVAELDDEDLVDFDSIEPGLPPASSDRRKWWLDSGLPARSNTVDTNRGFVPNSRRPPNPFTPSSEPDWVVVGSSSNGIDFRQSNTHDREAPNLSGKDTRAYSPRDQPLSEYIHVDGAEAAANGAPLARIDSFASSTSSVTGVRRKPAPPIPKKPPLLTSNSQQVPPLAAAVPALGTIRLPDSASVPPSWNKSVYGGSLPPPRRSTLVEQQAFRQVSKPVRSRLANEPIPNEPDAIRRPSLPARPIVQAITGTGLMDEDSNDDQVRNIPSLQPLRPR
ncbi:inositol polyphosphate 5-phosphatase [Xylographa bjoerkii]|nr:inositol polyphosphate 5-phosphatase [Xylographa bjoerkii]